MKQPEDKTNVMRILDQKKVRYTPHGYEHREGEAVDAAAVAALLGKKPDEIFKTLVARGAKGGFFVFVIPGCGELDLKKAAKAAGEKSIELLHVADLLPATGYVRGGCSPIGMKKLYPTYFDQSALAHDTITVSAGKIGRQIEAAPADIMKLCRAAPAALCREAE